MTPAKTDEYGKVKRKTSRDAYVQLVLKRARNEIRAVQHDIDKSLAGDRVRLLVDRRGQHSGTRYKAGKVFRVLCVQLCTRGLTALWLCKEDDPNRRYELAVWLTEVEFL